MRRSKVLGRRIISLVVCIALLISSFTGCGEKGNADNVNISEEYVEQIVETVSKEILEEINNDIPDTEADIQTAGKALFISDNWEDYIGDLETFVYGLISTELSYQYDVFPASVELLDGSSVLGFAYTDYSECYTDEEETHGYFMTGFLPFCGEEAIPQEDFDSGLLVENLEFSDENTSFVLAYGSEQFTEHCVVYNQYLKYGVDDEGRISYEAEEYVKGQFDETLGSLYSYDERRCFYNEDLGDYKYLTGTSLSTQINYEEFEKEINAILLKQDANFASVDVESCANFAQEAVSSYLLSLQEETFMGYDVDTLVEIAGEIDPTQCLRITDKDIVLVDVESAPKEGEEEFVKWLVGTGCVIVMAVSLAGSTIAMACPPLSACSSAAAGISIEIFMQVVMSNETLDNIAWDKVVLSAATGAISGYLGPYIMATKNTVASFVLDTALDGLLGGIENAAYSWLEGDSGKEIVDAFGQGLALGVVLSAGFKVATKLVEVAVKEIAPHVADLDKKVFPKLTQKASAVAKNVTITLADKIVKPIKENEKIQKFYNDFVAKKVVLNITKREETYLFKKSYAQLRKDQIFDKTGQSISKDSLKLLFKEAKDGEVLAYYKINGELVEIAKQNRVIGIYFDKTKYQTVRLPNGLVPDRNENFKAAAEILIKNWKDDISKIPPSIAELISKKEVTLSDISPQQLVDIIKKSDMVLHENIDCTTITLVARNMHDKMGDQGIGHMGGYTLAEYVKCHMGQMYFERFANAASSTFAGAAS